jgi:sulfur carrier protein
MTEITVHVNGARRVFARPTDVGSLVTTVLDTVPDSGIAVAVNGAVVPRSQWNERRIEDGDDIEIVRAVQGG